MNAATSVRSHLDGGMISLLRVAVRRSVPASDVDDVVQAALFDALRARRAPDRREEVSRWLLTIAKRRAADLHRSRARLVPLVDDTRDAPALSMEWRDAVGRAAAEADREEGTRRALELSLREAEGESYAELARLESVSEVAMRQRLSRFRRSMAARWLAVAALGLGALWLGRAAITRHEETSLIRPDPEGETTAALGAFRGRWALTSWAGAEPAAATAIEVDGASVRLVTPSGERALTVLGVERHGDASRWRLRAGTHEIAADVEVDGERARVTLPAGRWAGTAILVRR